MRFFEAFAGIGGFHEGILHAYTRARIRKNNDNKESPDNPRKSFQSELFCVGYSEIDKYACAIYEKHYPGVKNYGNIRDIKTSELPTFDLLVGGFPCQSFSIAGKRLGFEDTRGTLFFELARILNDCRTSYFCFENVKGLLSHDGGRNFAIIIKTLDDLGYNLQWQVINSSNYVPQNRERIFIVGNLRGKPRPEVFPIIKNKRADIVLPTLTARYGNRTRGGYIGYRHKKEG